jgi:hypothetical protein
MRSIHFSFFMLVCFFASCIVQAPKYTKVEQVLMLKPGMSRDEVTTTLGIPPYDMRSMNDKGETVLIYKYRVTDRKTVPLFMKAANGVKTTGKWVDLFVTFSGEGMLTKIESCSGCEETKTTERKLDINSLITFFSVTAPAVLVYLGLKD